MDVYFVEAVGPYLVLVGVVIGSGMMLVGYVLDWIRSEEVGTGPLNGRPQITS